MRRAGVERRARRLVRWYPKEWRLRYGEEFTQLLTDDISERPRSWHPTLDVARRGLAAQFAERRLGHSPSPRLLRALLWCWVQVPSGWIQSLWLRAPSEPPVPRVSW